jgi:type IV pilus assembly protein PilA
MKIASRMKTKMRDKLARSHHLTRGFTLIELMIVVVIMGVLASLATYSVSNYIQKSKMTEAREVVGQIMSAQEAYFDEVGAYMDVTGTASADSGYYPNGTFDGQTRIQWGGADSCATGGETCMLRFRRLGVFVNQPVMFRYASTTLATGANPQTKMPSSYVTSSAFNPGSVVAPRPGYVVVGLSDLNGDSAKRSAVVGTSLQAQLYIENPGE